MSEHRHRAVPSRRIERCWTSCVTPDACAGDSFQQVAHGGLLIIDVCRCGSERPTERNGTFENRGDWT